LLIFDPRAFYSEDEYARLTEELKRERCAWLDRIPMLRPEIASSIPHPGE